MIGPSKTSFKAAFQSRQAFLDFVKAPESPDKNGVVVGNSRWSNKDLEPTPPAQRTWTWYNLPLYWGFTVFGPTGWNVASSLINVGLVSESYGSNICGIANPTIDMAAGVHLVHSRLLHCRSCCDGYGKTWRNVSHWIVSRLEVPYLRKLN